MSATPRKAVSASVGSLLPYAIGLDGAVATPGNSHAGGKYLCPACRKPAVFDDALGRVGGFRHGRRGMCPLDDEAERHRHAVLRMLNYLESLSPEHGLWPWVTHVCHCGLEGLRDLKGRFSGFRAGDVSSGEPEFLLLDGQEKLVMSLFVRAGAAALMELHQSYSHRFIAVDPERALRTPQVWRLATVEGVANYRGVPLPPCPVCGPAEPGDKKTA